MNRNYAIIIAWIAILFSHALHAADSFVTFDTKGFRWIDQGVACPILTDMADYSGVFRAVISLQADVEKVTGVLPDVLHQMPTDDARIVIIGSIDQSDWIKKLVQDKKIEVATLKGTYEKYLIQTIKNPFEGVEEAVVIAGSDMRGTIYGIYELAAQMGVSPWYYWADVPVVKRKSVSIKEGSYTDGEPKVKYRGIFLNDEAPALSGWASKTFGGFNSQFYEKVFELILRLKGNFLWPAMWGNAFYDDDKNNGLLAHEMGIVIGTSHHEPLGRAHDEWRRYGSGKWDYQTNANVLTDFWKGGMERMKKWEAVVTVGMRGDGDEPMSEGANIVLLEKIVKEQRKVISDVTGKKASETPQMWALYKEVQDYYDRGMRVPDDITLMLCDDNWGNVRKLPELSAKPRSGGYGMYYHFDYVGGPRNYKWLNVSQVQRIWEQMNLTYHYGVKNIWIVNVGDLKPMEYPIQFFLDMAWNPDRFNESNLLQHTEEFCARQFGSIHGKEAARLIDAYTKYNRRVTPELLNENTYSLHNYDEFETVVDDYQTLLLDALKLNYLLPQEVRDAYDQLVLFPIQACANLYEMYYAVAMNRELADKEDAKANYWADKAESCFERDSLLTHHYNREISGGKWEHIMDQVHIGYTSWQQPKENAMPKVQRISENRSMLAPPLFIEKEGYVSMEAEHYAKAVNSPSTKGQPASWITIPGLGKTLSGVTTSPVTAMPSETMCLEYTFQSSFAGEVQVEVLLSPTLNFNANRGLCYAVSVDGGEEQIVNINRTYDKQQMEKWQANSINSTTTQHTLALPGKHTLRFRPLNPGIVLQKIMLNMGGLKPSYLGAPETNY